MNHLSLRPLSKRHDSERTNPKRRWSKSKPPKGQPTQTHGTPSGECVGANLHFTFLWFPQAVSTAKTAVGMSQLKKTSVEPSQAAKMRPL